MRQIELQLQKRLLIVEAQPKFEPKEGVEYYVPEDTEELFILPKGTFKLICKGSELTELKAFDFVEEKSRHHTNTAFKNYKGGDSLFFALESFISAIEANGYYWGENPLGEEPIYVDLGNYKVINEPAEFERQKTYSRTFNPEKTLIFEIL